jgi:hypothetical protein
VVSKLSRSEATSASIAPVTAQKAPTEASQGRTAEAPVSTRVVKKPAARKNTAPPAGKRVSSKTGEGSAESRAGRSEGLSTVKTGGAYTPAMASGQRSVAFR